MGNRIAAIVLSAGKGTRMNSDVPKQYLMLQGRPVLCYCLQAFQQSRIGKVILVCGREDLEYCQKEIVQKYNFTKVKAVVPGGAERYQSVYCGLRSLEEQADKPEYVMIHDGARPFVSEDIIERCVKEAERSLACVAGMPVKDTIKIADECQFAVETPKRSLVWQVQTPQAFSFSLIAQAYRELIRREEAGIAVSVTDDAMVLETVLGRQVRLVEGSYKNIKITTPEDLEIAKVFLQEAARNPMEGPAN